MFIYIYIWEANTKATSIAVKHLCYASCHACYTFKSFRINYARQHLALRLRIKLTENAQCKGTASAFKPKAGHLRVFLFRRSSSFFKMSPYQKTANANS